MSEACAHSRVLWEAHERRWECNACRAAFAPRPDNAVSWNEAVSVEANALRARVAELERERDAAIKERETITQQLFEAHEELDDLRLRVETAHSDAINAAVGLLTSGQIEYDGPRIDKALDFAASCIAGIKPRKRASTLRDALPDDDELNP